MSFKSEHRALLEKYVAEREKLEAEYIPLSERDEYVMYACRPLFEEYRRGVAELKKKYGLPPDIPREEKPYTGVGEDRPRPEHGMVK